ncbi:MAG: OstA-like protein [Sphingobacteriaceae bacterium]
MSQQKGSVVNLLSSSKTIGTKRGDVDYLKVYNGVFQQNNSTLRSDSAYFYPQTNSFDAFGHVNINQGDTLNIYADLLNYNGNTNIALLTNNVRMVDRDAVLTTNHFLYNTITRIGTYTGGGKLVNKTNTLVSKNGYYFAFSRDAYFRYDVVLNSPDAVIKSDTLRYNAGSKISYFYGPTDIIGKDDTLYTENGNYNTETEQAFFGKKNLYTQGTKTLRGDSLFYDRKKGYGRAVKNITFNDREQNITLKGDLGTYYKKDERTVVTENAYVIIVTEQRDTVKSDTVKKDSLSEKGAGLKRRQKVADLKTEKAKPDQAGKSTAALDKENDQTTLLPKDSVTITRDSIYMVADTLETQILTYKDLKILQEKQRLAGIKDTTEKVPEKVSVVLTEVPKTLSLKRPEMIFESGYFRPDFFGKPTVIAPAPVDTAQQKLAVDTSKAGKKIDSLDVNIKITLSDTSRIRILNAFHKVKIFKSDLQVVADSLFYSTSDSTMRCYINPMIWTQGSQLSADTIYLQMKNKKLDNMDLIRSSMIVNTELDSTHFNQVGGKMMRGYFADNKLKRMFVDGNAESIYFAKDSGKYSTMNRTLSSRIRVNLRNNQPIDITWLSKPAGGYTPLEMVKEAEMKLEGFVWKPEDRPISKESILPGKGRKALAATPEKTPLATDKGPVADALKALSGALGKQPKIPLPPIIIF